LYFRDLPPPDGPPKERKPVVLPASEVSFPRRGCESPSRGEAFLLETGIPTADAAEANGDIIVEVADAVTDAAAFAAFAACEAARPGAGRLTLKEDPVAGGIDDDGPSSSRGVVGAEALTWSAYSPSAAPEHRLRGVTGALLVGLLTAS
jgi:hypothetical protein